LIRAVVFDFDGVIANSEPLHFRAFRDVLADLAVTLTEEAYYSTYLGYHDADAFRAIAADRGVTLSEGQVGALVELKASLMASLQPGEDLLFPGARAAIERLAAAYPLAIASGALRAEILHVLDHERLGSFFKVVVAAEDVSCGKPAPDPYLAAVERLSTANGSSLAAGACVAVEDSRWGLRSAREAGLRTIGISHTYPPEELSEADLVITHLNQLTRQLLIEL
jgi:HAD superfamily hydrolase (TIGR01509 family)